MHSAYWGLFERCNCFTRDALRAARVKKRVGYLFRGRRRRVFITRDARRAARVKKRVGHLCRRVFIFLRRSHKW